MGEDITLDCHVFRVVVFQISRGFYFDKTPKVFLAPLKYVSLDDYIVLLKGSLKNGRNVGIFNKLPRATDRRFESARTVYFPCGQNTRTA